jgi:hypothetical protein
MPHTVGKFKGYNFALNITLIGGLHTKLWASKVTRVLISRILGLQPGSLETKRHLGVGPYEPYQHNCVWYSKFLRVASRIFECGKVIKGF